jgi:hypothetical protein
MTMLRNPKPVRSEFCSDVSAERGEPLQATASHVEHWILVEYRGAWAYDPVAGSTLSTRVRSHLSEQVAARPRSRLLFIRRPDRRRHDGLACFYTRTREDDAVLTRFELETHEDLLRIDFAADEGRPLDQPLFVVCTHGKRDRCCARNGRPLYEAVSELVEADRVWQSTHVGGDRFAGNLVCFPDGLYFGRVGVGDVWQVLDEYLDGRIDLDRYRGRCCYPFPVQAAERAVRVATGWTGVGDLRLLSAKRTGDRGWQVAFAVDGGRVEADVRSERGELTYLTCSAETPRHPLRFTVMLEPR